MPGGPPVRPQQAFLQLLANTRSLQVVMMMDRQEYFPSEDAEVTITVTSHSSTPMEILDPFTTRTGLVELLIRNPNSPKANSQGWVPIDFNEMWDLNQDAPAMWIAPKQSVSVTYRMSDPNYRIGTDSRGNRFHSICAQCRTPEKEGAYRYRYTYGPESSVDFSVVVPQLELWTEATLQRPAQHQERDAKGQAIGKLYQIPRRVRIMVLGHQNNHIIAISPPIAGPPAKPNPDGKLTGSGFGTFKRVVTSAKPIISLQASADSGENVTINYTDQAGLRSTIKLNAKREVIP